MKITDQPSEALKQLRAQLDAVDDQVHDLLMRRAAIVESVARDGGKSGTKIRPGREAFILRRLLARHDGALPRQAIIRFWRELFGAALIIEGGQTIAVCDGEGGVDRIALAREHFGPYTPLRRHPNPVQSLADLAREASQLAVLPEPSESDDIQGSWWPFLMAEGPHRLFVIGKLPFWTERVEGAPLGQAYVVAPIPPDPSGDDRSLIALSLDADVSRTRVTSLITDAGFTPGQAWVKRVPGEPYIRALIDVEGFVRDDDQRLPAIGSLQGNPVVIGAYAVPLGTMS